MTKQPKVMNIQQVNAYKRLQRFGDPESMTSQKLFAACREMTAFIVQLAQQGATLPLTYTIGDGALLIYGVPVDSSLESVRHFADAIAGGLIERIESTLPTAKETK